MLIDVDKIIVKDRYREETTEEDVASLADSISSIRLINPITVTPQGDDFILIAGESRLNAIKLLSIMETPYNYEGDKITPDKIPAIVLEDAPELERLQIELDENTVRTAFEWAERAALSKRILQLIQRQENVNKEADKVDDTPASKIETFEQSSVKKAAEKLTGKSTSYATRKLREEVALATALEDEAVGDILRKEKSAEAAKAALAKMKKEKVNQALAKQVGESFRADKHKIFNKPFQEVIPTLDKESFDLCITDPPYGMDANKFGDSGGLVANHTHDYDDSYENWLKLIPDLIKHLNYCMKKDSHIYIACDVERFFELRNMILDMTDWKVQRKPLIHTKTFGRIPIPHFSYRYTYECWLYAGKGDKHTEAVVDDVIKTSSATNQDSGHGAIKGREAYETFLRVSGVPGGKVIDPCAGTGSCLPPVHDASMYYYGIEVSPTYYGDLVKRLKGLVGN